MAVVKTFIEHGCAEWPLVAVCGVCGGELHMYPYPAPKGSGFCATCSPSWLESFLQHATTATAGNGYKTGPAPKRCVKCGRVIRKPVLLSDEPERCARCGDS